MGEEKRIRVQMDFDQQGFDELETLKSDLRAGSRADTVRYGLGLLRWAVDQLRSGGKILVEKDGYLSGVVFPFLATQQLKANPSVVTLKRDGVENLTRKENLIQAEDIIQEERNAIREAMRRARRGGEFRNAPSQAHDEATATNDE